MNGFLSMHCFWLFGDANLSRYSDWLSFWESQAVLVEVCQLCPEEYNMRTLNVEISKESYWHILGHSVCQEWEEVAQSWFLESCGGLWKSSTWKIQYILTCRSEHIGKRMQICWCTAWRRVHL